MNRNFTIKHVKRQEIKTDRDAGFLPFPKMGDDWEYKQSAHFFYYRYKGTHIYQAAQQCTAITDLLLKKGTSHLRRYNIIVDSTSNNTGRLHNTRTRKKQASNVCTSCKKVDVRKPGKCSTCQERDRIFKEEVQKIRRECEQSIKQTRDLCQQTLLENQSNSQDLIEDKCRIIKQLINERAVSDNEKKSALESTTYENKNLQNALREEYSTNRQNENKLRTEISKLKEKIQEMQQIQNNQNNLAQNTLLETQTCMDRMQNMLGQFEKNIAQSQANGFKMEHLFLDSMVKLADHKLSVDALNLKIEMGQHIAKMIRIILVQEFNVSSRNNKVFSEKFNAWFNEQDTFNLKKQTPVLKIPNGVASMYQTACPEGFYTKKSLLAMCAYKETHFEFINMEMKPIKLDNGETITTVNNKNRTKLIDHFKAKGWKDCLNYIYTKGHTHISFVHDILNTKIHFYYKRSRLFTEVFIEVCIFIFL